MSANQSTNSLIVPVQLNACYIAGSQTVTDAKADFSRLPWTNGSEDFNSSTPFLGESVLSPPFQDKNFELAKGVHLHWILPKAHRTYPAGTHNPPAAPNRWLIKRVANKALGIKKAQWIVESDYISEHSNVNNRNAVTVPNISPGSSRNQPFVYLGRQMLLASWQAEAESPTAENYFPSLNGKALTAFGYGEMAFNTFYPNCRSVFGLFDPTGISGAQYKILGWYSNSEDDIVQTITADLSKLLTKAQEYPQLLKKVCDDDQKCPEWLTVLLAWGAEVAQKYVDPTQVENIVLINWLKAYAYASQEYYKDLRAQLLKEHSAFNIQDIINLLSESRQTDVLQLYYNFGLQQALNWSFNAESSYPSNSLYYSQITVDQIEEPTFSEVAIGQTGTEALTAYLANAIAGSGTANAATAEQGLNTLLLAGSVQNDLVDLDDNLKESQHNHSFKSIDSGLIWRIRKMKNTLNESASTGTSSTGDKSDKSQKSQTSNGLEELPETVADALNTLNLAQTAYEKGLAELEAARAQLYADWCKYMNSCYPPLGTNFNFPDADLVKDYVEWELGQVGRKESIVGTHSTHFTEKGCKATGLAEAVLSAYKKLAKLLKPINKELTDFQYEVSEVPAPRYYQPKDPVVMFAADTSDTIVMPDKKALKVSWTDSVAQQAATQGKNNLYCKLSELPSGITSKKRFTSKAQNWSPQVLQWLTAFYPERNGSNVSNPDGKYSTTFITDNYNINNPASENDASFDLTALNQKVLSGALQYSGSTYVSAHTKKHMQEVLEAYLVKQYPNTVTSKNFSTNWQQIPQDSTYKTQPANNLGRIAYACYSLLDQKLILTQSLGGFHEALLQESRNMLLPIKDPLGFSSYQAFTETINQALSKTYPFPNIDDRFMPIRAGRLSLSKLAFLDYFGVETKANVNNVYVASSLDAGYAAGQAWLNPRLSQASRLNFRWLAANHGFGTTNVEMNSHPITSPICGWLLPNYFDHSLMVYDQAGNGLGSFSFDNDSPTWHSFPGAATEIHAPLTDETDIDPNLRKVLFEIQKGDNSFFSNITTGQETISPEYYAGHDSMAILMGKPVAVVRAQIGLEVQGGLASDQGWVPFKQQLKGSPAQTDAYEQVNFDIRLGENGQLNDGLLAIWEEDGAFTNRLGKPKWVNDSDTNTVTLTLADRPKTLTLLMDPHGIVHASSGILPVKTIRIPADQYSKALKKIEVTFNIRPLLTPTASVQLSLPQEQGYTWSWLEKEASTNGSQEPTWKVTPDLPLISQTVFSTSWAKFMKEMYLTQPTATTLWQAMLNAQWILPIPHNTDLFQVKSLDSSIQTAMTSSANKAASITDAIVTAVEKIIASHLTGVTPFNPEAKFQQQHLVEGWLKISPNKTTESAKHTSS